jgi:hypothetical protein
MVGIRVRLERSKTVWQRLPGHKSAWISHLMGYVFCAKAAVPLMRRNTGGDMLQRFGPSDRPVPLVPLPAQCHQ